jgi:hypothetical protein
LAQPLVADRFQPMPGARFDEMLATKLPGDFQLPPTALEQVDRNRLQPVMAFWSPTKPKPERLLSRLKSQPQYGGHFGEPKFRFGFADRCHERQVLKISVVRNGHFVCRHDRRLCSKLI